MWAVRRVCAGAVFPFLVECCAFYESILQRRPDGSYNIELSHSPEQVWDDDNGERYLIFGTNPTINLVFIRALFNATLDAAKILECDTDKTQKWQEILANLPQNPTLKGNVLVSAQRDGNTVQYAEILAQSKQMPLHLQNPWQTGAIVEVNGKKTDSPPGSIINVDLQPGIPVRITQST